MTFNPPKRDKAALEQLRELARDVEEPSGELREWRDKVEVSK